MMNDVTMVLLSWAITATIAAVYYYAGKAKHKLLLGMTMTALKEVAKGRAKVWVDKDNNLRIKANDD